MTVQEHDDVREWLESVAAPPSRLDIDAAVAAGRARVRSQRRLRTTVAVAVLSAVAVVGLPAAAGVWPHDGVPSPGSSAPSTSPTPAGCTMTWLTPPDGLRHEGPTKWPPIRVTGMDPTGRYVVGVVAEGGASNVPAVLWYDGVARVLPEVAWDSTVLVHSDGTVLAMRTDGNDRRSAWIYRGGSTNALPVPIGYRQVSEVSGINRVGDVVGIVERSDPTRTSDVVVWRAGARSRPEVLRGPSDHSGNAGIADDGTVVATSGGVVFRWLPDGSGKPLPLPARTVRGSVVAVRGHWATGVAEGIRESTASGVQQAITVAARWDLRSGAVDVIPNPDNGSVEMPMPVHNPVLRGLNAAGDVTLGPPYNALLRGGRVIRLPAPPKVPGTMSPVAVDDTGTIVAGTFVDDSRTAFPPQQLPVTWRCP